MIYTTQVMSLLIYSHAVMECIILILHRQNKAKCFTEQALRLFCLFIRSWENGLAISGSTLWEGSGLHGDEVRRVTSENLMPSARQEGRQ